MKPLVTAEEIADRLRYHDFCNSNEDPSDCAREIAALVAERYAERERKVAALVEAAGTIRAKWSGHGSPWDAEFAALVGAIRALEEPT